MSGNDPSLHGVLAELAERERERLGAALTVDDLLAYRRGELPDEAAEKVRDLLAADPEWAQLYLDLARTEELEAAGGDVDEATIGSEWQSFERQLAPAGRLLPFRRLVARYPLSAVAASFLAAVLATGTLLRLPAEPDATGRVVHLEAYSDAEPGQLRGREHELSIRPDLRAVILELVPPTTASRGVPPPARCRFEIRSTDRALLTGDADLQERGGYFLSLAPDLFAAGEVEIRLFDPDHPAEAPFATYHLPPGRAP